MRKFTPLEKKVLTLSSLGGMLEFYDFIIYGIFSVYFAHQFFPAKNQLISIIASYVLFVLGYVIRPVGGIIFSHIGDEKGRKRVLVITVVLMGLSSLGIGCLPTYSSISIWAPILLLILRLIQGIALGGELPSTYVYISESLGDRYISAFGLVMSGILSGLLLGMVINFIISHCFTPEQITRFGWRIPFFIGGGLCLISYKIRKQLQETSVFDAITHKAEFPIVSLFKQHTKELLVAVISSGTLAISVVTFIIFLPTYLMKIVNIQHTVASNNVLLIIVIAVIVAILIGYFAEKTRIHIGHIHYLFTIVSIPVIIVSFVLLSYGVAITFIAVLLGVVVGWFTMVTPAMVTQLFPPHIRLTGVALGYNLGFTIFGGLAPVVITTLIKSGLNKFVAPSLCVVVVYILSVITMKLFIKSNKLKQPL